MVTKHISFLAVFLLSSIIYAQEEAAFEHYCLFEHKSLTIGLAAPLSFENNLVGLNLRMYHNINEHICFGPELSYFKSSEVEIVDFDFVAHYIFETPIVGVYPLLGANYTVEREKQHQETETLAKAGVIYGIGIHRNVKNFTFFAEYTKVQWGLKDQFLTAGLMYNFN